MVVASRPGAPLRFAGTAAAFACAAAFTLALTSTAHAYSNFINYVRPIDPDPTAQGGGGGRLFTGSPADGYGCDVCHHGAEGAELQVIGLPTDGYVPGQSYEIGFYWPVEEEHIALMSEITDLAGRTAGATGLLPVAAWQPGELCDNGYPAGDVCRSGGAGDGCCRDMGLLPEDCAFPGERSVLWVPDCRSKSARMVWTAPTVPAGDVWFSAEMVTSDIQQDVLGDGVTSMRVRLRSAGASPDVTAAVGDCRLAAGASPRSSLLTELGLLGFFVAAWRRCRRARNGNRAERT